ALASATGTLVAQRIGASDQRDARRIGWHGLQLGVLIAAAMGASVYLLRGPLMRAYTPDAVIVAAAMPLLAWVMLFHIADAAPTIASFTLDRKSTRLNSSHEWISYAVFCLKK